MHYRRGVYGTTVLVNRVQPRTILQVIIVPGSRLGWELTSDKVARANANFQKLTLNFGKMFLENYVLSSG